MLNKKQNNTSKKHAVNVACVDIYNTYALLGFLRKFSFFCAKDIQMYLRSRKNKNLPKSCRSPLGSAKTSPNARRGDKAIAVTIERSRSNAFGLVLVERMRVISVDTS